MTTREEFQRVLEEEGAYVCGTTEEFDGSQGGIWLSGEEGDGLFGYHEFIDNFGVSNRMQMLAHEHGWMFEWNDPGTIMAWPA